MKAVAWLNKTLLMFMIHFSNGDGELDVDIPERMTYCHLVINGSYNINSH